MPLLALPSELIYRTAVNPMPTGFEYFLLSCRPIYVCGHSLITAHNARKEWAYILIGRSRERLRQLIYNIARGPLILRYIESVCFVYECNIDHDSASEKLWVHGRTNFETFKTLIKTLPYVDAASIDHKYPGFISMFLLAFLENLESRELNFYLWG